MKLYNSFSGIVSSAVVRLCGLRLGSVIVDEGEMNGQRTQQVSVQL